MNRFYVERKNINGSMIAITAREDINHLRNSLRVSCEEEFLISDGDGGSYICEIETVTKQLITLNVKKEFKRVARLNQPFLATIACAVPKNVSFEDVIDKCTQLGVDEIIPLITNRTQVKKDAFEKKIDRYNRVMLAAAKQSGVLFLPRLNKCVEFDDLINISQGYDLRLMPNLSQKSICLSEALKNRTGKKIMIAIGPEGDFDENEIKKAFNAGFIGVSLGESVLRVDTAAISAMSFLRLSFC